MTGWLPGEHGLAVLARAPEQLLQSMARWDGCWQMFTTSVPALAPHLEDRRCHALEHLPALELESDLRAALLEALQHYVWRAAMPRWCMVMQGCTTCSGMAGSPRCWIGEWAGWGTPLLDLAWLYWTIQWRKLSPTLWHAFLAGYSDGSALANGASSDAIRALALGQIASILVRSHGQPTAWEEWLRRLRWTLGLAFPTL